MKTSKRKASTHILVSPHPKQRHTLAPGIKHREKQMVRRVEGLRVTSFGGSSFRRKKISDNYSIALNISQWFLKAFRGP